MIIFVSHVVFNNLPTHNKETKMTSTVLRRRSNRLLSKYTNEIIRIQTAYRRHDCRMNLTALKLMEDSEFMQFFNMIKRTESGDISRCPHGVCKTLGCIDCAMDN